MGTPDFAVPSLRVLLEEGYEICAVVTQPDRPKGRKRELAPPPVKLEAMAHGIPVLQPEKLRTSDTVAEIERLRPDLIVTAAYGQILPKKVLDIPRLGCINVHGSLLPKYRGGAPIQHAIMNGESVTGVTIMYMAEGMDTGDMISKVEVPILPEDDTGTLFGKLSAAGAELLRQTVPQLAEGRVQAVPQNHEEATYAPNLKREDECIRWERTAVQIFNQVRALSPQPGAFTYWNGEVLKIRACANPAVRHGSVRPSSAAEAPGLRPGTVLQCLDEGIEVMTGEGTLWITILQPAGKKPMDTSQFLRGSRLPAGTVLG